MRYYIWRLTLGLFGRPRTMMDKLEFRLRKDGYKVQRLTPKQPIPVGEFFDMVIKPTIQQGGE